MDPCRASPGLGGRAGVGGACRWCAPVQSWARLGHREALLAEVPRGKRWGRGVGGRAQETPGSRRVWGELEGAGGLVRVEREQDEHRRDVTWPRCPVASEPVRAAPGWRGALQGSGPGQAGSVAVGGRRAAWTPAGGPLGCAAGCRWVFVQPAASSALRGCGVLADAFSVCWNGMLFSIKYGPR